MTATSEDYAQLREKLAGYAPMRIILREKAPGVYEGLTEETFYMEMSDTHVLVWWSGPAYSILGETKLNGIEDAEGYRVRDPEKDTLLVVDPLADDCPVEIDWLRWVQATSKYAKRNAPFRVRNEV
jgi:hypothetical protein